MSLLYSVYCFHAIRLNHNVAEKSYISQGAFKTLVLVSSFSSASLISQQDKCPEIFTGIETLEYYILQLPLAISGWSVHG